ncbi:MAG: translation initiation factor [Nanoarchaeota archaeon]|nr:translation initiation factor [Nanoarchaeota archaeon]MBU1135265.1 translation initiation factor [Nanoarchaeota archaeon]MBU2519885.1 translation initiation factor [Nanoarchaeota archaeon]
MSKICDKCGLPKELCVCEIIAKEKEKIKISTTRRRFGKITTLVEGISKDVNGKKIMKDLKAKLACGGTMKGNIIELQGDHKAKVKDVLIKMGFSADQIEMG